MSSIAISIETEPGSVVPRAGGGERGGYLLVDERLCYEVVRCGHSGDDRTTL